jgi:sulfatase maturation enzyme AslB (radical SAM superfamily)
MTYAIPLNHELSVELVIHALAEIGKYPKACQSCPVRKQCGGQCSQLAEAVSRMYEEGRLLLPEFVPATEEVVVAEKKVAGGPSNVVHVDFKKRCLVDENSVA